MKSNLKLLILVISTFLVANGAQAISCQKSCSNACKDGVETAKALCKNAYGTQPKELSACQAGVEYTEDGCDNKCLTDGCTNECKSNNSNPAKL